jgi:hypothetical protein
MAASRREQKAKPVFTVVRRDGKRVGQTYWLNSALDMAQRAGRGARIQRG